MRRPYGVSRGGRMDAIMARKARPSPLIPLLPQQRLKVEATRDSRKEVVMLLRVAPCAKTRDPSGAPCKKHLVVISSMECLTFFVSACLLLLGHCCKGKCSVLHLCIAKQFFSQGYNLRNKLWMLLSICILYIHLSPECVILFPFLFFLLWLFGAVVPFVLVP